MENNIIQSNTHAYWMVVRKNAVPIAANNNNKYGLMYRRKDEINYCNYFIVHNKNKTIWVKIINMKTNSSV